VATKKSTSKTNQGRRRSIKSPPVKTSNKTKGAAQRTASKKKKASNKSIKRWRLSLGPNVHVTVQISRTKTAKKKIKKRASPVLDTNPFKPAVAVLLIVLGLIGVICFAPNVFKPAPVLRIYSPPAPVLEIMRIAEIQPKTLTKSEPAKISIPDISLDSQLTTVGKQADGTLEVPVSFNTPGWYRLSPTPGELGPSVIVGHVDSPEGPAVFWRLRELVPGQFIDVTRADGTTIKFRITEVKQFEQNNFPTKEVYGNTDHSALRLITCGGSYNKLTGNYSHNTVIFAVLEP
jgi:hypothetical protein